MRFAFAGIDFLSDVFRTLIRAGWEPVKLFTRPCDGTYDFNDDVVAEARRLRLPIQLSRLRPPDLKGLQSLRCEALVVAGYPWLVTGWEDHVPYAFNIHPSPLPVGRGPYPLYRAILDQHDTWGVTAHKLSPAFDEGEIIGQALFPLSPAETHESLLARCQIASGQIALDLASSLPERWAQARPQGPGSYWPMSTDEDRTLDWRLDVATLLRRIHAYGYVETIATINGTRIFVAQASGWAEAHTHPPGTVVHVYKRQVLVAAGDGYVQLTRWSPVALSTVRSLGR